MTATTLTAQGGDVGTLAAPDGINAAVSAHGSIATLRPGAGNLAGTFTALTGSLPDITCDGSITAALAAGTTIGNLTASQNIAATVFATGSIGEIVTLLGNISGNITSQNGNIGKVIAGNDLSANITAIAGGIGDLIAGHNLAGNMSAHTSIGDVIVNGTISGALFANTGSIGPVVAIGGITSTGSIRAGRDFVYVLTKGDIAGNVSASADITLLASGSVSGNIYTSDGDVVINAGAVSADVDTECGGVFVKARGDIASQTVNAAGDIVLAAGGNITSGHVIAMYDVTLLAHGNIVAPDVESTESGVVSEAAGGRITTNATSSVDVRLFASTISPCSTVCVDTSRKEVPRTVDLFHAFARMRHEIQISNTALEAAYAARQQRNAEWDQIVQEEKAQRALDAARSAARKDGAEKLGKAAVGAAFTILLVLAPEPTFVTKAGAVVLGEMTIDVAWTGLREIFSGAPHETLNGAALRELSPAIDYVDAHMPTQQDMDMLMFLPGGPIDVTGGIELEELAEQLRLFAEYAKIAEDVRFAEYARLAELAETEKGYAPGVARGVINKGAGTAREVLVGQELLLQYPEAAIQREAYLRIAEGGKALDPLTRTGRRIDWIVIQDGAVLDSVETTSLTANKAAQIAKEMRIRQAGGIFVRDRATGELIDIGRVSTRIVRKP